MVWIINFMGTLFIEYLQFGIVHGTLPIVLLFIFHIDILSLKGDCKLLENTNHFISYFSKLY